MILFPAVRQSGIPGEQVGRLWCFFARKVLGLRRNVVSEAGCRQYRMARKRYPGLVCGAFAAAIVAGALFWFRSLV